MFSAGQCFVMLFTQVAPQPLTRAKKKWAFFRGTTAFNSREKNIGPFFCPAPEKPYQTNGKQGKGGAAWNHTNLSQSIVNRCEKLVFLKSHS